MTSPACAIIASPKHVSILFIFNSYAARKSSCAVRFSNWAYSSEYSTDLYYFNCVFQVTNTNKV